MEYYVKFINEENKQSYKTDESVFRLLYYIYGSGKNIIDNERPETVIGDLQGCINYLGPDTMANDYYNAYKLITFSRKIYGYEDGEIDLIRHRVISFHKSAYINPLDVEYLTRYLLSRLYPEYMSVFGVHLNTDKIHVHIGIHTLNTFTGRRFKVSFEKKRMIEIINEWLHRHYEILDNDLMIKARYERAIFNEK